MSDLTEFLLARIAEDEADRVTRFRKGYLPTPRELREADRWERESAAKRRIVEVHGPVDDEPDGWCILCDGDGWPCSTMASLASIYADHPDCRPEWKP